MSDTSKLSKATPAKPSKVAPATPPKDPSALKYCFHGQHSKPESTFKLLPGTKQKRRVCAECYTKIMADRRSKERAQRAG